MEKSLPDEVHSAKYTIGINKIVENNVSTREQVEKYCNILNDYNKNIYEGFDNLEFYVKENSEWNWLVKCDSDHFASSFILITKFDDVDYYKFTIFPQNAHTFEFNMYPQRIKKFLEVLQIAT